MKTKTDPVEYLRIGLLQFVELRSDIISPEEKRRWMAMLQDPARFAEHMADPETTALAIALLCRSVALPLASASV